MSIAKFLFHGEILVWTVTLMLLKYSPHSHLKEGICRSRKLDREDRSVATSGHADGKSDGSIKNTTHRVPAKRFSLRVMPPNSFIHCLLLKNFTPLLTFTQKELYVIYHCFKSTDQTIWLTVISEEPTRQGQRTSESQHEIKIHFTFFTNAPALFVHNSSVGVISKSSINVQLHVKPKPCRLWKKCFIVQLMEVSVICVRCFS